MELQNAEEVCEVLFLFACQPNLEAPIVEVQQFGQIAAEPFAKYGQGPELKTSGPVAGEAVPRRCR